MNVIQFKNADADMVQAMFKVISNTKGTKNATLTFNETVPKQAKIAGQKRKKAPKTTEAPEGDTHNEEKQDKEEDQENQEEHENQEDSQPPSVATDEELGDDKPAEVVQKKKRVKRPPFAQPEKATLKSVDGLWERPKGRTPPGRAWDEGTGEWNRKDAPAQVPVALEIPLW